MDKSAYESVLKDTAALLKKCARGKPPTLTLNKETALLLESIEEGPMEQPSSPVQPVAEEPRPAPALTPGSDAVPEGHADDVRELRESTGADTLEHVSTEIAACQKCGLAKTRTHTVPGEGNPHAALVFVGEAPGASEDKQGRPFVGRAGQLLTDIITKAMKMKREDVFICNVLKCRPPENRTPNPEEVMCCEPYLIRQLELIRPKVICALGGVAAQTLLKTNAPIYKLRGEWHNYHGIPFRVTYHPAYLLRNPADKAKAWQDIQEVMRCLSGDVTPTI